MVQENIELDDLIEKKLRDRNHAIDELSRRISEVEHHNRVLKSQLDTIVPLFEYRVDQIYSRINDLLANTEARQAVREVILSSAYNFVTEIDGDEFYDARRIGGYILTDRPTMFSSPLTAVGFRVVLGQAIERDTYLEVRPGVSGIVVYGPYFKINGGRYSVQIRGILPDPIAAANSREPISMDVYSGSLDRVLRAGSWIPDGSDSFVINTEFVIGTTNQAQDFEARFAQTTSYAYGIKSIVLYPLPSS